MKISFLLPTFNEEENVVSMIEELRGIIKEKYSSYEYEIVFIDNKSTDNTRKIILEECEKDKSVKAIFNYKNFWYKSATYGLTQTTGDCTVFIPSDHQVPKEAIVDMIDKWIGGAKIVCAVKESTEEKGLIYLGRKAFNKMATRLSDTDYIENYDGSGLYDKSFLNIFSKMVAEDYEVSLFEAVRIYGTDVDKIYFRQKLRKKGNTKNNIGKLVDIAFSRVTNASKKKILRLPMISAIISFFISFVLFIFMIVGLCIGYGAAVELILAVSFIIFLMLSANFVALTLLGEYIGIINQRVVKKPIVVPESKINFDE
ncbi:MAG: glycosyltransferase [Lachnospiraceae bacterium]|nr:glycosyltransferase [Lachnospiraceae bacterium]